MFDQEVLLRENAQLKQQVSQLNERANTLIKGLDKIDFDALAVVAATQRNELTKQQAEQAQSPEAASSQEPATQSEALDPPPQSKPEQFLSEAEDEHRTYGTPTSPAERTASEEAQAPQPLSESYAQSYPQLAKPAAKPRVSPTRVLQRGASEEGPPAKKAPKDSSER